MNVVGRLLGAVYVLALAGVLAFDGFVLVQILGREGVPGLWGAVGLHKLGEVLLVFVALCALSQRTALGGSLRSALVLAAVLLSAVAWWRLLGRAPWSWWCLGVVAAGLCLLSAPPPDRSLRRRVLGGVFALVLGTGYLAAIGFGLTVGSGYAFYPIAPPVPAPAADRAGRCEQDVDYLLESLATLHVNAYHTTTAADLRAAAAHVLARIGERSDDELAVDLARVVARVGDAHTSLPPIQRRDHLRLPIDVRWFGEELRVVLTAAGAHEALGGRIVSIDGTPAPEIRQRMRAVFAHEYVEWADRLGARFVGATELLQALGIVEDAARCRIVYALDGAAPQALTLAAAPLSAQKFTQSPRRGRASFEANAEPYWYRRIPESKTFYFRYGKCENGIGVRAVARELCAEFDAAAGERLVIDLRQNTGGSTLPFTWLVLPLLEERRVVLDEPGGLFVLIDEGTYSSGVGVAAELRRRLEPTLVGVPTGGHDNGYGEVRSLPLPNSGLRLTYSTRGPDPASPACVRMLPDVRIERTFADFVAGADPVLMEVVGR